MCLDERQTLDNLPEVLGVDFTLDWCATTVSGESVKRRGWHLQVFQVTLNIWVVLSWGDPIGGRGCSRPDGHNNVQIDKRVHNTT